MDKILQTGLSAGNYGCNVGQLGLHSSKPVLPDRRYDGKHLFPQSFCPDARARCSKPTKSGKPIQMSYISIGAWSWGDSATWHWRPEELLAVKKPWEYLYDDDINFINTAKAYSNGKSEEIVDELVNGLPRDSFVVQTKQLGLPVALTNLFSSSEAPFKALETMVKRVKLQYTMSAVAKGLTKCVDQGLTRTVGVANYSLYDFKRMREELAKYDIPLIINQCEFNILGRLPELDEDMTTYREMEVQFQSYSSLAQGRLTGKYNAEHSPPSVLENIGMKRRKKPAAVALKYNLSKGAVPIVGIRNIEQTEQAFEAFGWRITEDEVKMIDQHSFIGEKTMLWQQG
ncbi:NADP-dependent oxidoreductase domain-containing protein [Xylaria bambusicola]|uniref:NADP-dependent oxidoreductase domain-containing protein n=1 Tax=Xylaria bambusicola TaxID=326684 RepID=UPI002008CA57|nr:NADP-dependent oxidoreductase domain-containing protein [Xylaria bambusicola]KAI0509658.1 NADP-dependent oxidoreductase domain-containing protein [Xylaria bambusicola]